MIKKLFHSVAAQRQTDRNAELYRNLIRHEARIGGSLFGPVPQGRRREFFCLDEHTWVWHEEWSDAHGQPHVQTTRYDVRPDTILKSQNGKYQHMPASEVVRLLEAARQYQNRVNTEIYNLQSA